MTSKNIHVIITAAGSGKRFNTGPQTGKPKQFQNLLGKPVILHSLLKFQKIKEVKSIVVSAGKKYFNFIHALAVKNKITKLKILVEGGSTRFDSVRNAFNELNCLLDDIIMIHDAARPNLSSSDLKTLRELALKDGEVILGSKVSETVKRAVNNTVSETISRDNLWLIQTPQAFRYSTLSSAYILAGKKNDFTDESSLVEFAGYKVKIIEGSKNNIKITNFEDMVTLKKLMS
ncbi:MAG: 2-C-methyl-D-erythritol 4-phosphate cytidylyltransferase [Ignavibacteria bacterium]